MLDFNGAKPGQWEESPKHLPGENDASWMPAKDEGVTSYLLTKSQGRTGEVRVDCPNCEGGQNATLGLNCETGQYQCFRCGLKGTIKKASGDNGRQSVKEYLWSQSKLCSEHPYLTKKGVKSYGLRVDQHGNLVTPLYQNGNLSTLQFISTDYQKFLLSKEKGGVKKGSCFQVGQGNTNIVYLCEGYATAASVYEATGETVFMCVDAGNLEPASKNLRKKYPDKKFVFCSDNDRDKEPGQEGYDIGYKKASEAAQAVNGFVVMPERAGDDFNDLMCREGLEAVKSQMVIRPGGYITDAILTFSDFRKIKIPEKIYYLFPWLWSGAYGLLAGLRGIGKTFFLLAVLNAITKGVNFGPWECQTPAACLFVDGEMPMSDDQERIDIMGLNIERREPLYLLSSAYLCEVLKKPSLNLGDPETREYLRDAIITKNIKVAILDNVSSLTPGIDENSKLEWDKINQWLLGFRYAGVSVWLTHHLGKNGDQRGTSGREDNIDMSIRLYMPRDYQPTDGARFIVNFTKKRISHKFLHLVSDIEMQFRPDENGNHDWIFSNQSQSTMLAVLELLVNGQTQSEAAKTLKISKSQVSKLRAKLSSEGLIDSGNILTVMGKNELIKAGFEV